VKKTIKPIKILKKPTSSVRFGSGFISLKPKKPNWTQTGKNQKKQSQIKKTEPNRFLSKKPEPNRNRSVWTGFGFFLKKIWFSYLFFYKNRTEPKPKKIRKNRVKLKKPSQTGFCPKKPNQTETGRFEPISVFFLIWFSYLFFYKSRTEPKPKKTKKTEQNWKNRAKSVFVQKNRTELKPVGLNRFLFFF